MNESRALYSSQEAVDKFGNRFQMILAACARYRELKRGYIPMVKSNSGPIGVALEEIEAGIIGQEYVLKNLDGNRKQRLENYRNRSK